jgi:serine/threonine protein phosphatase 1
MAGRTIAIGDIHGCSEALAALIEAIKPGPEDTLIPLGDYIDRGPNSPGVLDQLLALADRCQLVPLLGDHEEMLMHALSDKAAFKTWLTCGGVQTLRSYGWAAGGPRSVLASWVPSRHRDFLASCRPYQETGTHLFMHAGFLPDLPMDQQPGQVLLWRVTDARTPGHCSGKTAIVGHTAQRSGEVLDLGHLVCIDTNCFRGGWLTALDTVTGRIWQADRAGRLRPGHWAIGEPKGQGSLE